MSDESNRPEAAVAAQQRLLGSEGRYRRLFETALDGILILDAATGRITEVNPFMAEFVGWSRDEFLNRQMWEIGLFKDSKANQETLEILRKDGDIRFDDLTLVTKRGDQRNVECVLNLYTEGTQVVIQCNIRDITARKVAEEQLNEAHSKLSFHVANTPLAVVEWDAEFRVSRWSSSAEEIFGWKADEVIGRRIGDWRFVFSDDLNTVEQLTSRQQSGIEQQGVSRNRNYTKSGAVLHCEWYNSVLRDRWGKLESVLSLVLDVTARRHAEEERARFLAAEQLARHEAEEANRVKDEFLATLSHELRTPLTAIVGWARLLSTGEVDPDKYPQAFESIIRNAKSQGRLIDDLLDVSRIITGKLRLDVRSVELALVIKAAVHSVRLAAQAKSIRLELRLDTQPCVVSGDIDRLKQVFWNLLSNAIKFTPRDGTVQVSVTRLHSSAVVQVRDTGPGIDPEFLPWVFDRFRQADGTTTRQHKGLGLGLAIVRDLVELHGGTVLAESIGAGEGASFTVKLPLLAVADKTGTVVRSDERNKLAQQGGLSEGRLLQDLRILVVDDELDARQIIMTILERSGADVRTATSVTAAMQTMDTWRPDVLISDIGLPVEDGYALIDRIRSRSPEQGGQIPALALTAYARKEDRARILAAGYQLHVPKPVEPRELVKAIANLVGR